MCYYRSVKIKNHDLLKLAGIERELSVLNIEALIADGFAYGNTPVVVAKADCGWEIVQMEWGFIPHYLPNRLAVNNFRRGYTDDNGKLHPPITTLNAIGEELLLPGKMYREAALKRRCLFISTGFYEWRHIFPMGKKGQPLKTAVKYPYHIRTKTTNEIHLTAGIWQSWTDRETGETVDTCALVTTKANKMMEQIHNSKKRMPCILTEALAGEWISDGLSEARIVELATFQYPSQEMEAWSIQKDFKTALDPLETFEYTDLPALEL
ncbi:MAG: SOS response-associated peptidase [Chitinophagaceae bacterium]|nr:SOS response-associated peptidase [Chitinophagaceae bacterium]